MVDRTTEVKLLMQVFDKRLQVKGACLCPRLARSMQRLGLKKDRREYNEAQELENLLRVFDRLDRKGDKKLDLDELFESLKALGYKCKKADVEDMIWEIDEDCDRCVTWEEFKAMFYRVRNDKSGWEPRRLFNVVEFMMHDKDCSGTIDLDECMEILFRRFGKDMLESKVNEFMSNDEDHSECISFSEFLSMDRSNDQAGTRKNPGFRLSAGIVQTTKSENERLLKAVNNLMR
ncbi:hypothetical protein AB1Y20_005551 [Prymnesium parvum]|uniref:EF-hand domain-containing protein n=1 Tax=Prymnesium parvum TaxID=97485 RepID=A0AB34J4H8_PRYPA